MQGHAGHGAEPWPAGHLTLTSGAAGLHRVLPMELQLAPKTKRAKGAPCKSEKQGLWAYYHVPPGALDDLAGWLG